MVCRTPLCRRLLGLTPALVLPCLLLLVGCGPVRYDPDLAARPYPADLPRAETADIQLFRDGTAIEIVNATPVSYEAFNLWINQRFVRSVASLPAGSSRALSLWDFRDERGEVIRAGGFFRTQEPTPVVLAEIETTNEAGEPVLIGLITIPSELDPRK